MYTTSTIVPTAQGQRLITRLGRHWGHKFTVTLNDNELSVPFNETTQANMQVQEYGLCVRIDTSDEERLETLKQVVADHLQRFAKNQTLVFHWQ